MERLRDVVNIYKCNKNDDGIMFKYDDEYRNINVMPPIVEGKYFIFGKNLYGCVIGQSVGDAGNVSIIANEKLLEDQSHFVKSFEGLSDKCVKGVRIAVETYDSDEKEWSSMYFPLDFSSEESYDIVLLQLDNIQCAVSELMKGFFSDLPFLENVEKRKLYLEFFIVDDNNDQDDGGYHYKLLYDKTSKQNFAFKLARYETINQMQRRIIKLSEKLEEIDLTQGGENERE